MSAYQLKGEPSTGAPNDPKRAVALARRARALRPDDLRVADTLGWALFKTQQPSALSEAVPLLKQRSTGLGAPETYYHYGAALAATGDLGDAKEALERALGATRTGQDTWHAEALVLCDQVARRLAEAGKPPP